MCNSETLHIAADLSFIHTDHLWKIPGSWTGYDYYGPDFYEDVARIAQRGMFDMLFFGDAAETPEVFGGSFDAAVSRGVRWPKHDMMPMVAIMARAAPKIGFGLTMSTTYHHPFHVARLFSSLDWITGGRAAWNAVTSAFHNEGANYGYASLLSPAERYARAREHLHVVRSLWDSVEPDALKLDRETGIFADPSKVHFVDHKGQYFTTRGPLPTLPSRQGRPVIIQAGQSSDGMDLAARFADLQFASRHTPESIRSHRAQLNDHLRQVGRSPRDIGVLWAVRTQVGHTREEAERKDQRYLEALPPQAGLMELSALYGVDFSALEEGMRLADVAELVEAQQGHWGMFAELVKTYGENTKVEELGRRFIIERGAQAIGTPAQVADKLEEMHEAGDRNGGIILSKAFAAPGTVRDFVDMVVPELQRRGLMRKAYTGDTLRAHLDS